MNNLIKIDCPFCQSDDNETWTESNDFKAVKCLNCGFVYLNPRPSIELIDEKNKIGFHGTKADAFRNIKLLRTYKVTAFKKRLSKMKLANAKSWLDIGAGSGEFIYALKHFLPSGAEIEGIEPAQNKAEIAQSYHLNVTNTPFNKVEKKYDGISMINVFSHLPDPVNFITELKEKLNQGGYLLIVTGNGGDLTASEYPDDFYFPDHLVFAGESHVTQILQDCGFSIISFNKYKYFLPENIFIRIAKASLSGNALFNKTAFRSIWILARLNTSQTFGKVQ